MKTEDTTIKKTDWTDCSEEQQELLQELEKLHLKYKDSNFPFHFYVQCDEHNVMMGTMSDMSIAEMIWSLVEKLNYTAKKSLFSVLMSKESF